MSADAETIRELARAIEHRRRLFEALEKLLGWTALARLLDRGIAASVDADPCWTEARALLAELRSHVESEPAP